MASLNRLLSVAAILSLTVAPVRAAEVDFAREIYPILQQACFECHGPAKQRSGLRLDSRVVLMKGGDGGPVVVPGKPEKSELLRRVELAKDSKDVMPPRGNLLSKEQHERLRRWIEQGAPWPDNFKATHWAYVKPLRPATPAVKDSAWPRNPIDHFVLARLEKEGLKPSPAAAPAVLLRRLSLDLIGLPPLPKEVEAFEKAYQADAERAVEAAVDRLLAGPHFGERWARPWLDLARYADSHGFQRDDLRTLWPFRDWVIRALNDDMPFDRFTIEQIAGDLLPKATVQQKVATGFHRCTPTNVEAGSDPEETRVNQVFDRVNTTATVWLGTTLECAQCHDHKFDPFTQADYYRLFAFFNSTAIEADRTNPKVPGSIRFLGPTMTITDDKENPERARLEAELAKIEGRLQARRKELAGDLEKWEADLRTSSKNAGRVHVLEVNDFVSSAGSPHKTLDDHSILLVDDPPDKDTYTITVKTKLTGISGFKLETLSDPSLPGKGPGRGDAERPNFVLHTFAVGAATEGQKEEVVKLVRATASFSQKNYDVAGAIDTDPKTAWAIGQQFHQDHWASFDTEKPVGSDKGMTLTFTLVQDFGKGRTIGRLRLSALTGDRSAKVVPADVLALLEKPADKRTEAESRKLLDYRLAQDDAHSRLTTQNAGIERTLQNMRPPATLVMQELPKPRETHLFVRGDFRAPVQRVEPGTPTVLPPMPEKGSDRVALARWLVSKDNPLTARVTVNRWWAELFGRGLVATPEDFGIKGEPPPHPELLDWLAVEFMDKGWSMKKLLRTIVLSASYRQASRLTPQLRERDDQNRLLARGPRLRLDAETIRDNALVASGLLSSKQFGPPVQPYQPDGLWTKIGGDRVEYIVSPGEDRYRRGVYTVWKRSTPYPSFVNFDATARLACTVQRSRTNTPLQALTLLNDPVYVEAALALAKRVVTDVPKGSLDERLTYAFRLCLARAPSAAELKVLRQLYEGQRAASRADPAATRELLTGYTIPRDIQADEFAAWYAVAATLLNLDETITKG